MWWLSIQAAARGRRWSWRSFPQNRAASAWSINLQSRGLIWKTRWPVRNFLAAVNGGYFDPEYNPIGLLIVDGKIIAPLQKARLLSGVLGATGKKIQISRVAEFSLNQKLEAAVESGPMIVDQGKSVRGLESSKSARRTFAAIASGDKAALGFCSDVTLADLSNILASIAIPNSRSSAR